MNHSVRIEQLQSEIEQLKAQLSEKTAELERLKAEQLKQKAFRLQPNTSINNQSRPEEKIKLFRSLFQGREDVYALRFESVKTGKSGYQPACRNEWRPGICNKPRIKCADCKKRHFLPMNDDIIRYHLTGEKPSSFQGGKPKPWVVGVYPLLVNEYCWFLAVDFDKEQWKQDARMYLDSCREEGIPAYLERSRSGNGGHVWIFFEEPVPARIARNLGSALMTKTLDKRPEIGLDSFDRFFPNQDTMPKGGFGNLIALPLQKRAREKNHSVFLDESFVPVKDQWKLLASIQKVPKTIAMDYVQQAAYRKEVLPVSQDENYEEDKPWEKGYNRQYPKIDSQLPSKIEVVLSNQIFVTSTGLPPVFRNRILRLASFSNPEFYKKQAMRLPIWGEKRVLYCYDQFPQHIAIPIGCLDELEKLLVHYNIGIELVDKRNRGTKLDVSFLGELYPEQRKAAEALQRNNTGILSATTAFGKTVVGLWLLAERKVNTLILVHRKQLMDQWVERITQFLGVPKKEIGRFGGGRKKLTGNIDVAVFQSVCYKGEVKEWVKDYGQVIVDECHHISAFSFEQTIRQSSAFYKLGLSATLTRKDGQHPIVNMNLGQVRYVVSARKQALRRNFSHTVQVRTTQFTVPNPENASKNIQDLFRDLWMDIERNKQIIRDVLSAHQEGKQILVLSERTEHLELLKGRLEEEFKNLFVLRGGLRKKQLNLIMDALSEIGDDESRVILATGKYLGEGFDLPILDTLFLTFPISWRGTLAQYAGRLHREHHGKTEVNIIDYVDNNVPVLEKMYSRRVKGYKSLGYTIK